MTMPEPADNRPTHAQDDPVFLAGVDLLRRTGASGFQLRYSDDQDPIVWVAVSQWHTDSDGRPVPKAHADEVRYDTAAALNPRLAVLRMCEQVVDGGICQHCQRPAGCDPDTFDTMPGDDLVCWYQYDPELATFRRSCEGDNR